MHLGTATILKGSNQLARKLATGWHPVATTILKGWNQSAQGCEERATLGLPPRTPATLKGLYQIVRPIPAVVSRCTPRHGGLFSNERARNYFFKPRKIATPLAYTMIEAAYEKPKSKTNSRMPFGRPFGLFPPPIDYLCAIAGIGEPASGRIEARTRAPQKTCPDTRSCGSIRIWPQMRIWY